LALGSGLFATTFGCFGFGFVCLAFARLTLSGLAFRTHLGIITVRTSGKSD